MDFLRSTASAGNLLTIVGAPLLGFLVFSAFQSMFWSKPKWQPTGKHCVVTGGSSGLGLAFATLLVKKGAHVAIIARDQKKLATALEKLEAARVHPDQKITSHAFSLATFAGSKAALESASEAHGGRAPDALFTCAGVAKPGYFLTMEGEELADGMTSSYWIQAYPALAATKMMAKQGVRGRIVFVSSTLGYMGFIGYSTYSPGKHAVVGLTETLRSELALYNIDVQLFVPCTMYTEGYENENKTKPEITLQIESTDEGLTADQAALHMLKGVQKGHAHFSADLITEFFRVSTRGSAPNQNVFKDMLLNLIAWILDLSNTFSNVMTLDIDTFSARRADLEIFHGESGSKGYTTLLTTAAHDRRVVDSASQPFIPRLFPPACVADST